MRCLRFVLTAAVMALLMLLGGTAAFAEDLVLPSELARIEEQAFYGDTSLDGVILPDGLESIGSKAFAFSSLKVINLPGSLPAGGIADDAFEGTSLERVFVPGGTAAAAWADEKGLPVLYVVSGQAGDITATSAWVPLTFSVPQDLADQGYRMGVAYSETPNGIGIGTDGRLTCMNWTWGDESGVGGQKNGEEYNGWLDEMIPGHTYYYTGCLLDRDDYVAFLEEGNLHSFTTLSLAHPGAKVQTLELNGEQGSAPKGYVKTAFRFVAPKEGWYVLKSDAAVDEMNARRTDDSGCGWAHDEDCLYFHAVRDGEEIYLFVRDFDEDAVVRVENFVNPEDSVSSSVDIENRKVSITLDISAETAENGYGFYVEYSPYESFEDEAGNRQAGELFWEYGDGLVRKDNTVTRDLMGLIPGMTYYYRGVIDYFNGQRLTEEITAQHSFTMPGDPDELASITVDDSDDGWAAIPEEQETVLRFTADQDGFYAVEARNMDYLRIIGSDGIERHGSNHIEGDMHFAVLSFGCRAGETVYIAVRGQEGCQVRLTEALGHVRSLNDGETWVWDNHYVSYTAAQAGWYNVRVSRTDFGGIQVYFADPGNEGPYLDFFDEVDTQTVWLDKDETCYMITWYDMERGEQIVRVEQVAAAEQDAITASVQEENIGDTWAEIDVVYSLSEESYAGDEGLGSHGYTVGVVFGDAEIRVQKDGSYIFVDRDGRETDDCLHEDWTWDWNTLHHMANGETLRRGLNRLIPEREYWYFAYLRDAVTGETIAHTAPAAFATGQATDRVVPLQFGDDPAAVPDGGAVYCFTPAADGMYAVVSQGLSSLEIRSGSTGNWIAGDSSDDWDDRDYPYCQGFMAQAGMSYYIFADNHFDGVLLSVEAGDDVLPTLTAGTWTDWFDGRQVFRFAVSEPGYYRFDFDGTDFGELKFANLQTFDWDSSGQSGWGGSATRYYDGPTVVYPGCWFDNEQARVSMKVTKVTPPETVTVQTLDVVDVSDISATFGMELGVPVPDGKTYTYGVLLRVDDASFEGGSAWEGVYADMSMVVWNQDAPLEEGYRRLFSERPLLPDTGYCCEAFVGVYDPAKDTDTFYYGGLERFRTEGLSDDHAVTAAAENQPVAVSGKEGYQIFSFTVPTENAADLYSVSAPECSIWAIDPDDRCYWPEDTPDGRRLLFPGRGCEGETFLIYVQAWNRNGSSLSVAGIAALEVGEGENQQVETESLCRFTLPDNREYLIAAEDGGRIKVFLPDEGGFNHRSGWGWVTDPNHAGEDVLFLCERDDGNDISVISITLNNMT